MTPGTREHFEDWAVSWLHNRGYYPDEVRHIEMAEEAYEEEFEVELDD